MKLSARIVTLLVLFLFTAANCSYGAPLYSQWGSVAPISDTLTDPAGLSPNLNINTMRFASDSSFYYFRMDIAAPNPAMNAAYGFILQNTSQAGGAGSATNGIGSFTAYLIWDSAGDISAYGIDPNLFKSNMINRNVVLEWKVDKNEIDMPFSYYAASYIHPVMTGDIDWSNLTLKDRTQSVTVTPIPSAAWLLVSGLIGLIGIRRRTRKPVES